MATAQECHQHQDHVLSLKWLYSNLNSLMFSSSRIRVDLNPISSQALTFDAYICFAGAIVAHQDWLRDAELFFLRY